MTLNTFLALAVIASCVIAAVLGDRDWSDWMRNLGDDE